MFCACLDTTQNEVYFSKKCVLCYFYTIFFIFSERSTENLFLRKIQWMFKLSILFKTAAWRILNSYFCPKIFLKIITPKTTLIAAFYTSNFLFWGEIHNFEMHLLLRKSGFPERDKRSKVARCLSQLSYLDRHQNITARNKYCRPKDAWILNIEIFSFWKQI